jgi:hypothetical protein
MACETDVWDPKDWPPSSIDCNLEFFWCPEEVNGYSIFLKKPLALTVYLILGVVAMNEFRIGLRGVRAMNQAPRSAAVCRAPGRAGGCYIM